MNPKISVIIPVYNVEKYLDKCIQSVLNQTFADFELLLINDGSKDGSGAICDKYAQEDSRVKVFHKENGGVSAARNLGLDNAKGEWVCFVDSDDFILEDSLNILEDLDKSNKDIYMFKTSILQGGVIIENEYSNKNVKQTNELWKYIFKKEIIDTKKIRFIGIKYGEDYNFISKYFLYVRTGQFIDEFVYVYRKDNPSSAMNKVKDIHYVFDHFVMVNDLLDYTTLHFDSVNERSLSESIVRGFKMTLVVLAKTEIDLLNKKEVIKKYNAIYSLASKKVNLCRFHPVLLEFWINYYKKRTK
ncbi:glycosyltransferase involved in cell wall biosynthesis [Dysgonomonadaceae bacterium PH5-43]|nr:glycosyltransferase involved in cell wall biosynthesis [Dysgonomonadaceae bacterium PH5-43]